MSAASRPLCVEPDRMIRRATGDASAMGGFRRRKGTEPPDNIRAPEEHFRRAQEAGGDRNLGMGPGNRPHDLVGADVPQFRPVPGFDQRADRTRGPRPGLPRAAARADASRGPRARRFPAGGIFRPGRAAADRIPDCPAGRRGPLDCASRQRDSRRERQPGGDVGDFDRQHPPPRGRRDGRGRRCATASAGCAS